MTKIVDTRGRYVLDSRGKPTVEVDVWTEDGARGRAIAPSGASTGSAEAVELRDGEGGGYDGAAVERAVANVGGEIRAAILGIDVNDQEVIDETLIALDGTANKRRLGGNTTTAVSLAVAHAAAAAQGVELYLHLHELWRRAAGKTLEVEPPRVPVPMTNMISGGLHAGRNLDFQDFLLMPRGALHYAEGLEQLVRVYWRLGALLRKRGWEGWLVGDEGGYGPRLGSAREALTVLMEAVDDAGLEAGQDVEVAIDVAATHFFDAERDIYVVHDADATRRLGADEMIDRLAGLVDEFPIRWIEDPLFEDDWSGWSRMTARLGDRVRVIGDDLFATSASRLARGVEVGAANAVLIKVNQAGTLSEALRTMAAARRAGMACVVSARSGETEDTTIADLAVATAADSIKIGSVARGERLAKYNRLLRIDEQIRDGSA